MPIINCHACQIKLSIVNIAIPNFPAFVTVTCYTIFMIVKVIYIYIYIYIYHRHFVIHTKLAIKKISEVYAADKCQIKF